MGGWSGVRGAECGVEHGNGCATLVDRRAFAYFRRGCSISRVEYYTQGIIDIIGIPTSYIALVLVN